MNRELLEKPFDKEQVKQREGTYGNVLDYIEGHAVIQRLNDAFNANWSFEILKHGVLEDKDEVIVLGKLTAENVIKTQFGSSQITRDEETGEIVSISDDMKAAATDALKKAATLFGIGLHLYAKGDVTGKGQAQQKAGESNSAKRHERSPSGSGKGKNRSSGNGNGRITEKQHSYILRLINESGMTRKELNDKCLNTYGVAFDYLTRSDASTLISELLNE